MLNSYPAVLKDGQLSWIGEAPDSTKELRVVVLTEVAGAEHSRREVDRLLAETRGILPRCSAVELNRELEALRSEWHD